MLIATIRDCNCETKLLKLKANYNTARIIMSFYGIAIAR